MDSCAIHILVTQSLSSHSKKIILKTKLHYLFITLLTFFTYVRSWAFPEKLPIVQPFRKFPAILRNPKVHHRVRKSPLLVTILSQFDPVPTIPSYLSKIHLILSTHLRLGLPIGLFPSGFPTNILYAFILILLVIYKITNKVCVVLLRCYKAAEFHHHSPTLLCGEMIMYRDNCTLNL
jgi:hypothetical protein